MCKKIKTNQISPKQKLCYFKFLLSFFFDPNLEKNLLFDFDSLKKFKIHFLIEKIF